MDKLQLELTKVKALVGFSPEMASGEISRQIATEKMLIDAGLLSHDEKYDRQMAVHNLEMLVVVLNKITV